VTRIPYTLGLALSVISLLAFSTTGQQQETF